MPYRLEEALDPVALPTRRWIIGGGVSLAALAGYVNVVALGVFTVPASHMTGAVSRLGSDLATGNSLDLGLVGADTDGNGDADYVSIPWSQADLWWTMTLSPSRTKKCPGLASRTPLATGAKLNNE